MNNQPEIFRGARSPFREMQEQFNRIFDQFSALPALDWPSLDIPVAGAINPRCDMSEDANNYFMKFEMPGIPKDQIKVELHNNVLSVSAERTEESKKEDERQYLSEFSYGSYFRSMTLPVQVDEKKIDASFKDGVLSLRIPKTEASKAKQIAIH